MVLSACGGPSATPSAVPATPSASATATATPTSTVAVSDSLDGIKVSGEWGKSPKVEFKAPFAIDKTRVRVIKPGNGAKAQETGYVTVNYYGVNGRTGKKFDDSYSRKATATFPLNQVITGFRTGLAGQAAGSRVLIAMPGSDAYDSSGGSSDGSIKVGDTLVFVVDIVAVSLSQPEGKSVPAVSGQPTVTGGAADKPTVTIGSSSAPTAMSAHSLIEGTGAKVVKGDTVLARYVGYSWKTGKLIDDQFATPSAGLLSSTIPGWQKGLLDKTVGSRVLLVLPPEYGYPKGSNNPPLEAGDTIVYVVDLLFAYKA